MVLMVNRVHSSLILFPPTFRLPKLRILQPEPVSPFPHTQSHPRDSSQPYPNTSPQYPSSSIFRLKTCAGGPPHSCLSRRQTTRRDKLMIQPTLQLQTSSRSHQQRATQAHNLVNPASIRHTGHLHRYGN
jgi:hypothetical protein